MKKKCPKCRKSRILSKFSKDKSQPSGRCCWCKDCVDAYGKNLYRTRKSKKLCVYCGKKASSGVIYCYACGERTKKTAQKTYATLKLAVVSFYCKGVIRCMCPGCPIRAVELLTVDHIKGGGRKHTRNLKTRGGTGLYHWIKRNNFPPGFQVLCGSCNMSKSGHETCERAGLSH